MNDTELIRKSPAVLIMKILVVEALTELVYLVLHASLGTIGGNLLGIEIGLASAILNLFMFLVGVIFIISLTSLWVSEGVYIKKDEVVNKYGVLRTKYTTYPYTNIQRVEINQSFIGKLLNFGTVSIYVPVLGVDINFSDMPSPTRIADYLKSKLEKPTDNRYIIRR